jgi:hypothetical protein
VAVGCTSSCAAARVPGPLQGEKLGADWPPALRVQVGCENSATLQRALAHMIPQRGLLAGDLLAWLLAPALRRDTLQVAAVQVRDARRGAPPGAAPPPPPRADAFFSAAGAAPGRCGQPVRPTQPACASNPCPHCCRRATAPRATGAPLRPGTSTTSHWRSTSRGRASPCRASWSATRAGDASCWRRWGRRCGLPACPPLRRLLRSDPLATSCPMLPLLPPPGCAPLPCRTTTDAPRAPRPAPPSAWHRPFLHCCPPAAGAGRRHLVRLGQ